MFILNIYSYLFEIQYRILFICNSIFTSVVTVFFFRESFLYLIVRPLFVLQTQKPSFNLLFLNLTEVLETYFCIAIQITLSISLILLMFQWYSFLSEALFVNEKKIFKRLTILYVVFTVSMFIALYLALLPNVWNFFISLQITKNETLNLEFVAQLSQYVFFFLNISSKVLTLSSLFFAIVSFIFLCNIELVKLTKNRKHVLWILLLIATFFSPPDVLSQLIFFITMICFTEGTFLSMSIKRQYAP